MPPGLNGRSVLRSSSKLYLSKRKQNITTSLEAQEIISNLTFCLFVSALGFFVVVVVFSIHGFSVALEPVMELVLVD